jgi:hypothetical protein
MIEIVINRRTLEGTVNLVGEGGTPISAAKGEQILRERTLREDLAPDPSLPDDTRIWAALQDVSGGPWGGAVYDPDAILKVIEAGKKALRDSRQPSAVSSEEKLHRSVEAIPPEQAR